MKYMQNVASFIGLNPHWRHILWDDSSLQLECRAISDQCLRTYLSFPHMHQKIDFGRYVVLYRHGGTSVDIDMHALRPFDDLAKIAGHSIAKKQIVISYSPASQSDSKIAMYGTSMSHMYNNAWILAKPKAIGLKLLINKIIEIQARGLTLFKILSDKFVDIMHTTGPVTFTVMLTRSPKVLVLDKKYFENDLGWKKGALDRVPKDAFVFHEHENSWIPHYRKIMFKLWNLMQKSPKNVAPVDQ